MCLLCPVAVSVVAVTMSVVAVALSFVAVDVSLASFLCRDDPVIC